MAAKRAFIAFDFDHDEDLRNLLVGQAQNPDTPFEIRDWSVRKPWAETKWETKCLERIRQTDVVIVIVGEHTSRAEGVSTEIALAKKAGIPYFGLHGRSGKPCAAPTGLEKVYTWTWENLKLLIAGSR
jgi:hypothetical protein